MGEMHVTKWSYDILIWNVIFINPRKNLLAKNGEIFEFATLDMCNSNDI